MTHCEHSTLQDVFQSLMSVVHFCQCLKRLPDESMADESMVVALFKHELNRIMRDRISRSADLFWFDDMIEQTIAQVGQQQI